MSPQSGKRMKQFMIGNISRKISTDATAITFDKKSIADAELNSDSSHQSIVSSLTPPTNQQHRISEKYVVLPRITGQGVAGSVRKCIDRQTLQTCAVKTIQKTREPRIHNIQREVAFLAQVNHPNIIEALAFFEDEENVHIVTEMCYGGELFDKIVEKVDTHKGKGCFSEHEAARILQSLLSAVSYLHKNDIIHRDIKPENILFSVKGDNSPIKLIDLGLSIRHGIGQKPLTNMLGTAYYMAPEVINGSYDRSCDLWSVGIIAYILLSGRPPFNGPDDKTIIKKIRNGKFEFDAPLWESISEGAKDFIRCLINYDPSKRWTADMAMQHHWLMTAMMNDELVPSK